MRSRVKQDCELGELSCSNIFKKIYRKRILELQQWRQLRQQNLYSAKNLSQIEERTLSLNSYFLEESKCTVIFSSDLFYHHRLGKEYSGTGIFSAILAEISTVVQMRLQPFDFSWANESNRSVLISVYGYRSAAKTQLLKYSPLDLCPCWPPMGVMTPMLQSLGKDKSNGGSFSHTRGDHTAKNLFQWRWLYIYCGGRSFFYFILNK